MKNKVTIPFIVLLIASITLFSTIFLPYSTAVGDYADSLSTYSEQVIYEEIGMTAGDMENISMVEFASLYSKMSEQLFGTSGFGVFYVVLVALIGIFSALVILFSTIKKPIPVIIFTVLSFVIFSIQNWDYTDRGVIPNDNYSWGLAYYIFYIASIILLVGAIWLIVAKAKLKKQSVLENASEEQIKQNIEQSL